MDHISLRRPDDWHLHLRDGVVLAATVPDVARRFARAIVMPNLKPAVRTTAQALDYRERILGEVPEGASFEPLMTLYLTDDTPPEEIARARISGRVFGVKLYPAGATTHSAEGVTRISRCFHALEKMEELGLPLLVHGESTDPAIDVFDREQAFIEETLGPMLERFPRLKVVMVEGGFAWLPALAWRLDKLYERMRSEVPHLRKKPSEYIRQHIWVTTQPMEEPEDRLHLFDTMEWIGWDRLLFASDYPHWDFDDPFRAFPAGLPQERYRQILTGNGRAVYRLG